VPIDKATEQIVSFFWCKTFAFTRFSGFRFLVFDSYNDGADRVPSSGHALIKVIDKFSNNWSRVIKSLGPSLSSLT